MDKDIEPAIPLAKIAVGSEGLGTVSPDLVEQRALELAKTDGRAEANEKDLAEARAELLSGEPLTAAEVPDPAVDQITAWDDVPAETGSRAPKFGTEDEANIAQVLVEEGLEEADHDARVAAAETFPPEE
jgi:hypothetical protein